MSSAQSPDMTTAGERLRAIGERVIGERLLPGAQIGFVRDGRAQVVTVGRQTYERTSPMITDETLYDVASITKSIPTSSAILKLAELGKLSVEDPLIRYVPEMQTQGRETILLRHLLTFTATLKLPGRMAEIALRTPERVLPTIFESPLAYPVGSHYAYSNAASTLLGLVAERVSGRPLDVLADDFFFGPLGMNRTTFRPEDWPVGEVAPTEVNQRGLVQRQVHDEGAWAIREQGGIPGHAGLFSTASDLLKFAQMLISDAKEHEGKRVFRPATIREMYTDQIPGLNDPAGLGWALRWPKSLGLSGSGHIFGKTGFTGTVIAIDPIAGLALVFLTNRTYPQRNSDWPTAYTDLWIELMRAAWS